MEAAPVTVGTLFSTTTANNAITQIIAPSNNLHGLFIRTCIMGINSPAGSNASGFLVADTAAPASIGAGRVIAFILAPANTSLAQTVPYEMFVPAGLGLWWAANASSASNAVLLTYDFAQS
jgi:hypothetical protein